MQFKHITLKPHQVEYLKLIKKNPYYYFAWGGGSGKTMMLSITSGLMYQQKKQASLVITTPLLCVEFKENLKEFYGIRLSEVSDLSENLGKRRYINGKRNKLVCMTYNGLLNNELMAALAMEKFDAIYIDEAHKIKNPQGKMAKSLYNYRSLVSPPRIYMFSATILTKSYEDLFMQLKILDDGATYGKNFYSDFKSKYYIDSHASWRRSDGYHPKYILRDGCEKILLDKLKGKAHFIRTKDVTELPDYHIKNIKVDMTPEQAKDYKNLKQMALLQINENANKYITSYTAKGKPFFVSKQARRIYLDHVLGVISKLRQIASGFSMLSEPVLPGEEPRGHLIYYPDHGKIKFMRKFLPLYAGKEKIIVWHHYKHSSLELRKLCADLKIPYAYLMGGLTPAQREAELNRFKKEESCRVLIANPKSAGEGVNLTLARICVYFTQDYSFKDDFQSAMRNFRHGSTRHKSVIRINLLTKGTIDSLIKSNIKKKEELAEFVVKYIKGGKDARQNKRGS